MSTFLAVSTLIAILLGPILAVQIDRYIEREREGRKRRVWIFRELMLTRALRVSPRHVEALNGILLEFSADKKPEKKVVDAWKLYSGHLSEPNPSDMNIWLDASARHLIDLLYEMSCCLGYGFNKQDIKAGSYYPSYLQEVDQENNDLRKALLATYSGKTALKVENVEPGA
jgi:hypothetical protein